MLATRRSLFQTGFPGDGADVARGMEDAQYDEFRGPHKVITAITMLDHHAQSRSQMIARRARLGEIECVLQANDNVADYPARGFFGGFADQVTGDFAEVGARPLGQAEGSRPADSSLPRAMMSSISASTNRPASRSFAP